MSNRFTNFSQKELEIIALALLQLDVENTFRPTQWNEVGQLRSAIHSEVSVNERAPAAGQDSHFLDQKA